ncbi:MAG: TetR/AcrR family transcriptional regulator [Motilibacteraceae bacterium]
MTEAAARPRGRRSGSSDTRSEILAAAREEFASRGYDGASVRGIARAAGVDPALVHHYFGGKEQVFVAAMQLPLDPSQVLPRIVDGDPARLGERLARVFLAAWSDPAGRAPFVAMVGAAMTNEQAATMLREFVTRALLGRVVEASGAPRAELRHSLAGAQLVGTALLRYVVRVEPLASASEEDVVAALGPVLQRYLAG